MIVQELIEKLKDLPQDATVYTEGCDCYGPSDGACLIDKDDMGLPATIVLIQRNNSISSISP